MDREDRKSWGGAGATGGKRGRPRSAAKMKVAEGKFAIMGNVNTTNLLMSNPEEIEKQVIDNLVAGVDIVSPGCAISPECPNTNLQAMARAIARWHRDGKEGVLRPAQR